MVYINSGVTLNSAWKPGYALLCISPIHKRLVQGRTLIQKEMQIQIDEWGISVLRSAVKPRRKPSGDRKADNYLADGYKTRNVSTAEYFTTQPYSSKLWQFSLRSIISYTYTDTDTPA